MLFFGRRAHTEELLERLSEHRFLAVVGASGSGKSSLVRAGLLPALYRGYLSGAGSRWSIAVLRPGSSPLSKLATALATSDVLEGADDDALRSTLGRSSLGLVQAVREAATVRSGGSLLVVVDQFEELFRFQRQSEAAESEAALFVSSLLEASGQPDVPIYVILTMRSDFLGDCARFPGLPEALNESQYLIPRLTREERRKAIEGPLRLVGARIPPQLVQRLLNDAGDDPDQLPVLQHALMRTYKEWKGAGEDRPLELRDYAAAGAIQNALDQHADSIYVALPDDAHRELAAKVFRSLTTLHEGAAVRRPATLEQLDATCGASEDPARKATIRFLIRRFAADDCSFLLSSDGDRLDPDAVIDISHESLIRNWGKLRSWVQQEARSAEYYLDVCRDAALHEAGKASLWRGQKLETALEYVRSGVWSSGWARRYRREDSADYEASIAFLERSHKRVVEAAAREEERRDRELKDAQRLLAAQRRAKRWLVGAVSLLLLLLATTLFLFWLRDARDRAVEGQRTAQQKALTEAEARRAAEARAAELEDRADSFRAEADRERAALAELEDAGRVLSPEEIDQRNLRIAELEDRAQRAEQEALAAAAATDGSADEDAGVQRELEAQIKAKDDEIAQLRKDRDELRDEVASLQPRQSTDSQSHVATPTLEPLVVGTSTQGARWSGIPVEDPKAMAELVKTKMAAGDLFLVVLVHDQDIEAPACDLQASCFGETLASLQARGNGRVVGLYLDADHTSSDELTVLLVQLETIWRELRHREGPLGSSQARLVVIGESGGADLIYSASSDLLVERLAAAEVGGGIARSVGDQVLLVNPGKGDFAELLDSYSVGERYEARQPAILTVVATPLARYGRADLSRQMTHYLYPDAAIREQSGANRALTSDCGCPHSILSQPTRLDSILAEEQRQLSRGDDGGPIQVISVNSTVSFDDEGMFQPPLIGLLGQFLSQFAEPEPVPRSRRGGD